MDDIMIGVNGLMILIILILIIQINTVRVLWFYRPDCGHCQRMHNEWDKFETSCVFTMFPRISPKKININEESNIKLSENYNVQGVPHIVKLGSDGYRDVFNGTRDANAFMEWSRS